jgi:adenosylcobinamide-phosphate synthase
VVTPAWKAAAVATGLVADRFLGEPPGHWHPVAGFGRLMTDAEQRLWADDRRAGAAFAAGGAAVGVAAGVSLAGPAGLAAATWVAVAGRALASAARQVQGALERGDLDSARHLLRSLVGRRPDGLDSTEIARAAVESVAENTVDAVVAPAFWATLGGAPAVLGYRAVNTLDAMVGHRNPRYERFGWASARADDLANWVPARLTAVLVAAVRPRRARQVWAAVRQQAPAHPSPNAGVAEAAFAAALGVRLGGVNDYAGRLESRPPLGSGRRPGPADIEASCRLSDDVARAATGALLAGALWRRK